MATAVRLKYLFSVVYKDGATFQQAPEDVSKTRPGGSAFSDINVDEVQQFWLWDGGDSGIGIDLETGIISTSHAIYGYDFTIGDPGPKPYKLIFHRQHTHNFNIDREELSHVVKYCIGYTDANNVEHKILID